MHLTRLTALFALITAAASNCFSQSIYKDQYMMPDPQTWSFIKYGGQTPDLYTGTVRAEIPVYSYSDTDFDIPISLTYASNGYLPNVQANFVGLGWILNAGGCVSRKVQGIPDDGIALPPPGYIGYEVHGWLEYTRLNHSTLSVHLRPSIYSGMYCYNENTGNGYRKYETESDIYTFNFLGHSGKFVIGDDGEAIVFDSNHPAGEYKIDMSDMAGCSFPSNGLSITTGDGYKYDFGHIEDNQRGASQYTKMNAPTSDTYDNFGNSFQLRQITAPNGRTIIFNYHISVGFDMRNDRPFGESSTWHRTDSTPIVADHRVWLGSFTSDSQSTSYILAEQHRIPRLESIDIDGKCTISFTYDTRTQEKNSSNVGLATPQRLCGIIVTDVTSGRILRECSLDHCYSSGNPVMMLKSASITGLGVYEMDYYHENGTFPKHGCVSIDHWGYYNSNTSTDLNSLLPEVEVDNNTYAEYIIGTTRDPDPEKAIYGMLRRITYPTGGNTEYEYEPHTYRKLVTRDLTSEYHLPYLKSLDSTCIAGGLRVHKITDTAGNGVTSVRTYSYDDNGVSSGIMLNLPRYSEYVELSNVTIQQYEDKHSTSLPSCTMDEPHIGYSKVTEHYADGSSISTSFTDFSEFPDIKGDLFMSNWLQVDEDDYIPIAQITYPDDPYGLFFENPQSMSILRGRLKEKICYSSEGKPLKSENISYYGSSTDTTNVVKSIRTCYGHAYVHNTFVGYSPILMEKVETFYENNDSIGTETSYTYNSDGQPTKVSSSVTGGDSIRDYYQYLNSSDVPKSARSAAIRTKTIDGDEYIISKEAYEYEPGNLSPTRISSYAIDNPIQIGNGSNVFDVTVNAPVIESNYTYDALFRLTRADYPGNAFVSYTWNGINISSKTINGNGFRYDYLWRDFVGLTKKTDPTGQYQSYTYDDRNRLEYIKDMNGNAVEKYEYHTVNE